ncbi:MAG: M24 family metallopeptidase [Acidimicrobiales bacterium]
MDRRRASLGDELDRAGIDQVLVYGAARNGGALQWLCQWPVTQEAALVWSPGEEAVLFVEFANHVPNATAQADGAEVRWGGGRLVDSALALLRARGSLGQRVGILGPLPAQRFGAVEGLVGTLSFLDGAYQQLRLVKSDEELEWLGLGASLTDMAVMNLVDHATIGCSEIELSALFEEAYLRAGGTNHIHYLGTTSMESPELCVPRQWPTSRRLRAGDVLVCEVSASWWGYPGQLLRTFSIGCELDRTYRQLHDVADEAFAAVAALVAPGTTAGELAEAAQLIERAGYETMDDIVHGFGGGYLPPVVPGGHRPGLEPSFELRAGMTLVVQPNVVSPNGRAGVQTGELLVVTGDGSEPLHRFARGAGRIL